MSRSALLSLTGVRLLREPEQVLLLGVQHLELEAGRLYGVVGTNFSGRSALLRILGGGGLPHSLSATTERGRIQWDVLGQQSPFESSRDAVYLGPDPRESFSTLATTVEGELGLHQELSGSSTLLGPVFDPGELLERFRLGPCSARSPLELSGGQASAVALCSALLMRRPILCIDETFAQLDSHLLEEAWGLLRRFTAGGGMALVSDNQYDRMAEQADSWILLQQGQVECAPLGVEVFTRPAVLVRGTVPAVTRFAERLGIAASDLPTRYQQLLDLLGTRWRREV